MPRRCSSGSKVSFKHDASTDNDDSDPGREVIEKNIQNRLQRIADHTKEELNKVLKRVDNTLHNYDHSVQSSLIQHGMTLADMSNVEHVADIKELEDLLNDSFAKQRYKQRLMIFIVGQTEQVSEKAKLLQQIEQFFNEQKQNFSGREFNTDDTTETQDEIRTTLKSFDVKDCYIHVKALGTRLNELNEEIIQYLIQNAGTKQQAKGKKKIAQAAKETKEQFVSLQSKLESASNDMINKDNKIETLEKELQAMGNVIKTNEENQKNLQDDLNQYKTEIKTHKKHIKQLDNDIKEYRDQIEDLTKTISDIRQSIANDTKNTNVETTEETDGKFVEVIAPQQTDEEQVQPIPDTTIETPPIEKIDKETQTSDESNEITDNNQQILPNTIEDQPDVNLLFNSTELIDSNDVPIENLPTAFTNLRKFAIIRIRELLKELEKNNETAQNLKQEFDEYKITCEKEQNALIEKVDNASQLQIKAQKAAEESLDQLELFMNEEANITVKTILIHQKTQTDQQDINASPEQTTIEEASNDRSAFYSKAEIESIESFRRTSLKEKYVLLLEEKKHELNQLREQADTVLSRPASVAERISLPSIENSTDLIKHQPSFSSRDSIDDKENQADIETIFKQDYQQQTSFVSSRNSSAYKEKMISQIDQFKLPFFHLYEMIYKFRQSIINLLEQNKFVSLAECLQMIKQLSSDDNNQTNDFVENSERVLKDILKILQTCLSTLISTINEKGVVKEFEPITETPLIDHQQSQLLQQKESTITELTTKYEHISNALHQMNTAHEEELKQNEHLIHDQQKLIQNLQQEITRLQNRLTKIESDGIVEPSIMFTRLDAERNDHTLQRAVSRGKVPETTYTELNETMTDYVRLPSKQLSNLVRRYIQFRKASELDDRIQSGVLDNETKIVLEKMELLHERRSDQISERISNIRQQRAHLARTLTEKFDHLEDESCIFLIRPVYSYQGRAAAQSYMKHEKHRREALINASILKKKHHPSRQSFQSQSSNNQQNGNQPMLTPLSSFTISDDDDRLFHIENSFNQAQSSPTGQQNNLTDSNTETQQVSINLPELTRLQESDIQRALMPVSHVSTNLYSAFTNNVIDPCVPSLNLRTYVALSRPGVGNARLGKSNEVVNPVSREGLSALSIKSQGTNPRTPYNSSAGDLRRKNTPLPPIKRLSTSNISPINEKQLSGFVPSVSTNENLTTN